MLTRRQVLIGSAVTDGAATSNETSFDLDTASRWKALGHEDDPSFVLNVNGRIVAGAIDVLTPIACTLNCDVPAFAASVRPDRLLLALDAADFDTAQFAPFPVGPARGRVVRRCQYRPPPAADGVGAGCGSAIDSDPAGTV
jgi:hypothetical protein